MSTDPISGQWTSRRSATIDPYAGLAPFWDAMRASPRSSLRLELDLWQSLCVPQGVALEVGCGTGRVLLNLLERGVNIQGLDASPVMLDHLRGRAQALGLRPAVALADMRDFHLPDLFHTVLFTHRTFHHLLNPEDQVAALSTIRPLLAPGGRLAVECIHLSLAFLTSLHGRRPGPVSTLMHPASGEVLLWFREGYYHEASQILEWSEIFEQYDPASGRLVAAWRWTCPLKLVFRHELEHLLARCGFHVTARFGNHDKSPISPQSPLMIFVAECDVAP